MNPLSVLILGFFKLWNKQLRVGRNVVMDPTARIARGGSVSLGEGTVIRAGVMLLPSSGSISIGKRTSINQYTVINGQGGVTIGDSVLVAAFVAIFAGNHRFSDLETPISEQGTTATGIHIEDDVWIGSHAVILDGVSIGKGSVIGAGTVVTKDVLPYSVVMGVPGKTVRSRLAPDVVLTEEQS